MLGVVSRNQKFRETVDVIRPTRCKKKNLAVGKKKEKKRKEELQRPLCNSKRVPSRFRSWEIVSRWRHHIFDQ